MARWNDLDHRETVLKSAAQWREMCFVEDQSLFGEDGIWNEANLEELHAHITDFQFGGDRNFFEKLDLQLADATPAVIRLAAEILWLIYLVPLGIRVGETKPSVLIATKRNNIIKYLRLADRKETENNSSEWDTAVWDQSAWGDERPTNYSYNSFLSDDVLAGLGSVGQAYNQKRPEMFEYLLRVLLAWKRLPVVERIEYLSGQDGFTFGIWLDQIGSSGGAPIRHALLYLLFPDDFERIVSSRHKHDIVRSFKATLARDPLWREFIRDTGQFSRALSVDADLRNIRYCLENRHGHEVDFYLSPWVETWRPSQNMLEGEDHTLFEEEGQRVTEDEEQRVTENGEPRVTESGSQEMVAISALMQSPDRLNNPLYHQSQMGQQIADVDLMLKDFSSRKQEPIAGIGHNNPPEDSDLTDEFRNEVDDIRKDLQSLKLQSQEYSKYGKSPEVNAVAKRLNDRGTFWRNRLGDNFVDSFGAEAGRQSARWLICSIAVMLIIIVTSAQSWVALLS